MFSMYKKFLSLSSLIILISCSSNDDGSVYPESKKKTKKTKSPKSKKSSENKVITVLKGNNKTDIKPILKKKRKTKKKKIVIS